MIDRETSCASKKFYSTEKMAKKVARECERKRPETPIRVYQCTFCGMFHLTSTPKFERSGE